MAPSSCCLTKLLQKIWYPIFKAKIIFFVCWRRQLNYFECAEKVFMNTSCISMILSISEMSKGSFFSSFWPELENEVRRMKWNCPTSEVEQVLGALWPSKKRRILACCPPAVNPNSREWTLVYTTLRSNLPERYTAFKARQSIVTRPVASPAGQILHSSLRSILRPNFWGDFVRWK